MCKFSSIGSKAKKKKKELKKRKNEKKNLYTFFLWMSAYFWFE